MFQDEGASTDVTGMEVCSIAWITGGKGWRISPEKLKPKMASTMWSDSLIATRKSSVNGTLRFFSCVARRCLSL
jgi:hypothetical protein